MLELSMLHDIKYYIIILSYYFVKLTAVHWNLLHHKQVDFLSCLSVLLHQIW